VSWLKNLLVLFSGKPAHTSAELPETVRLLFSRRSCRSFTREPLREQDIQTILEAGRFAPSTVNLQSWSFITFSKDQWQETFTRPIPFKATYAITICADIYRINEFLPDFRDTPCVNLCLAIFNAGLAAMSMNVAAEALGIRSIMLSETGRAGLLDYGYLREKLQLPENVLPLTTLVLGRSGLQFPGIPPRQPGQAVIMQKHYDLAAGSKLSDWYEQMFIGYKLTHPLSSFDSQIGCYRKKMVEVEQILHTAFLPARSAKEKPVA